MELLVVDGHCLGVVNTPHPDVSPSILVHSFSVWQFSYWLPACDKAYNLQPVSSLWYPQTLLGVVQRSETWISTQLIYPDNIWGKLVLKIMMYSESEAWSWPQWDVLILCIKLHCRPHKIFLRKFSDCLKTKQITQSRWHKFCSEIFYEGRIRKIYHYDAQLMA